MFSNSPMKFALPLLLLSGTLVQFAHAAPVPASRADDFVDSMGLCTHWSYYDTPYGDFDKASELLGQLGIRHIRDGLHPRERELWERFGIKTTALFDPGDVKAQLQSIKDSRPFLAMIEGPNEVDIFENNAKYKGQVFPEGARLYQKDLYDAVKSDPATASLGVIALSTARAGSNARLAPLDSFDFLVMHSYAGGNKPSDSLESDTNNNIRNAARLQGPNTILKPIVVTESGYHTAGKANLTIGGVQPGVCEATGAKYFPRHFAEYFNAGIKRTFTYEFLNEFPDEDSNAEASFGIVRRDFSPKPAYIAIKNLIGLLSESKWNAATKQWDKPSPNFSPRALDFELSGDTKDVHSTLLQKADGTFYLLLWREVSSFDTKAQKPFENAAATVTIKFKTFVNASGVRVSNNSPILVKANPEIILTTSTSPGLPLQPIDNRSAPFILTNSVSLDVPDEVVVVKINSFGESENPYLNPDQTPPAPPLDLAAKTTGTSVSLAWKPSPDKDVAGYFVSRLGRELGCATGTTFADEKLDPATGYTYSVRAYDNAGNISQPATLVAMTQNAFPDLVVSNVKITQGEDVIGGEAHFEATVQNIGNAPTPPNVTIGVAFEVDGRVVAWSGTFQGPLAAGESLTVKSNGGPNGKGTWTVAAGAHTIRAIVDDVNRLNESNEGNNVAEVVVGK